MTKAQIRVGVVISPVEQLGINHYLKNLFAAMCALPDSPLQPVVFTGRQNDDTARDFAGVIHVRSSLLDRKSGAWWARKLLARIAGRDLLLERLLIRHGVQVLSHSATLGKGSRLPCIGWIADLQHMRLPKMFTPEQLANRDRTFGKLCDEADTIIVSSACGLEDLRAFCPAHAHKGEVLHFVSATAPVENIPTMEELRQRYQLEKPYLLLPNQFWLHKNHALVVEALRVLHQRGQLIRVVCTGSTKGLPGNDHLAALMQRVQDADVAGWFRVLGIVPLADLSGLMHHAVAWINPSRFEGWSTSVEESKSAGKTMLLSSIPVHQEQAPARGIYFSPDDPVELADAMQRAVQEHDEAEDDRQGQAARAAFAGKLQAFGETYQAIVLKTLRHWTTRTPSAR